MLRRFQSASQALVVFSPSLALLFGSLLRWPGTTPYQGYPYKTNSKCLEWAKLKTNLCFGWEFEKPRVCYGLNGDSIFVLDPHKRCKREQRFVKPKRCDWSLRWFTFRRSIAIHRFSQIHGHNSIELSKTHIHLPVSSSHLSVDTWFMPTDACISKHFPNLLSGYPSS